MLSVGVVAQFRTKPGCDAEMAAFFREGLPIVEIQPETTVWFAFQVNETTYGAFAGFASAEHRDQLLASGGPQLSRKYGHLFTEAPSFENVDILEFRSPARSDD